MAADALEEGLMGAARYPTRDSAAQDLDRLHAELAHQQEEVARDGRERGRAGDGRPAEDTLGGVDGLVGPADGAGPQERWGDDGPPPF